MRDDPEARAILDEAIAAYATKDPRVPKAVAAGVDSDPLEQVPAKPPKLPPWIVPAALSRPLFAAGGALPDEAVAAACEMLAFFLAARALCRRRAAARGLPSGEPGRLRARPVPRLARRRRQCRERMGDAGEGDLGGDACARDLTRQTRAWGQAGLKPRGKAGIAVLAEIGTDVALMNLSAIAETAFAGDAGPMRQLVGEVRSQSGALVCDPWSIAADRLIVPDVEPLAAQRSAPPLPSEGVASSIDAARALLAGALHAGRRADAGKSGAKLAATLVAEGYLAAAERLKAWLGAPPNDAAAFAAAALWVAAVLEDAEPVAA